MKKITARMIREKGSCYDLTELEGVDSKTAWILLEWMNYKHYESGANDAIWVFSKFAPEGLAREFAIWCARRCKTDSKEIKAYLKVIEGHYIKGTHTKKQMEEAYEVAHEEAYEDAFWAAFWAEYEAAGTAAYWAAYEAAGNAADRQEERNAQLRKIKRMLKAQQGGR